MSKVGRAVYVQVAGLIAFGLILVVAGRFFPIADWLALIQKEVMSHGAWSAALYPILYACCNVLLLPGGVLSIGGGFFFGLWWGFLIILIGNVTGAAIAFLLSRLGRRWLRRRFQGNRTFNILEPAVKREGWKLILLSQLHPLFPTSLLNYLYGLTTIRFRTCMLWVAIGQAPGLFLYAYIGTLGQLGLNLLRGKTHPHAIEFWIWIGGFVLAAVVLFILGRIALRMLQEVENEEDRSESNAYAANDEAKLVNQGV
jgi:uncharacterized membrane protein YdjX (TVP38/TMEM64 family)